MSCLFSFTPNAVDSSHGRERSRVPTQSRDRAHLRNFQPGSAGILPAFQNPTLPCSFRKCARVGALPPPVVAFWSFVTRDDCRPFHIFAVLSAFFALLLAGCVTPSSTAIFYLPYTTEQRPPKPKDAPIPIFGKPPSQPHKTIGRLSFATDRGWRFLRESMLYNARANGADAVVLKDATSREQVGLARTPSTVNWVPVPGPVYQGRKGNTYYGTQWVPIFQPGFVYPTSWTITAIDAVMIVFKR